MNDQEFQDLLDEYAAILEGDLINAIDLVANELQDYIDENYPLDTDQLPEGNNLDEIALERLETQLSSTFSDNLAALSEKSESNILLILLLLKSRQHFKNNSLSQAIKFEIKEIVKSSNFNNKFTSKKLFLNSIGLTKNQQNNLNRYRNELLRISKLDNQEIPNWKFLRNLSSSQRMSIRKLAETGIKESQIDSLIRKQKTAMLFSRAKAISNTLSTKISHEAQQTIIDTAITLNLIKPGQFRRFWITAHDEKVRSKHSATEANNPNGVGLQEPFNTPFGERMNPPLEINCRCHVSVRKANV